jgi:hypothetical protein
MPKTPASTLRTSALADSLRALLTGKPRRIEDLPTDVSRQFPRAQGMMRDDVLYLAPEAERYGASRAGRSAIPSMQEQAQPDVRGVALHEAGHLYRQERPAQTRPFPTYEQATSRAPMREGVARNNALQAALAGAPESSALGKSVAKMSSYAAADTGETGDEAYADAFANAWDFLSRTAAKPTATPRQLLADYEAVTPGTGTLVQNLLKEKLFRNHPYAKGGIPADRAR